MSLFIFLGSNRNEYLFQWMRSTALFISLATFGTKFRLGPEVGINGCFDIVFFHYIFVIFFEVFVSFTVSFFKISIFCKCIMNKSFCSFYLFGKHVYTITLIFHCDVTSGRYQNEYDLTINHVFFCCWGK